MGLQASSGWFSKVTIVLQLKQQRSITNDTEVVGLKHTELMKRLIWNAYSRHSLNGGDVSRQGSLSSLAAQSTSVSFCIHVLAAIPIRQPLNSSRRCRRPMTWLSFTVMVVTGCADVPKIRNDLPDGQNMFNHLWLQKKYCHKEKWETADQIYGWDTIHKLMIIQRVGSSESEKIFIQLMFRYSPLL